MSGQVLVVDDDANSVGWVVEALELAGFETLTAKNGAEALRIIASLTTPPTIVLLDLMMPVMNGWDVIASLIRRPNGPKVIVMSAYCKGGIPAGAHAVLEKPLTHDAVVDTVRQFCDPA